MSKSFWGHALAEQLLQNELVTIFDSEGLLCFPTLLQWTTTSSKQEQWDANDDKACLKCLLEFQHQVNQNNTRGNTERVALIPHHWHCPQSRAAAATSRKSLFEVTGSHSDILWVLPPRSKHFLRSLYQMDTWDKFKSISEMFRG